MEKNERQAAREHLVTAMLAGQSWQEAAVATAMPVKRAMAYRLLRAVRTKGNTALQDGRHGHGLWGTTERKRTIRKMKRLEKRIERQLRDRTSRFIPQNGMIWLLRSNRL